MRERKREIGLYLFVSEGCVLVWFCNGRRGRGRWLTFVVNSFESYEVFLKTYFSLWMWSGDNISLKF